MPDTPLPQRPDFGYFTERPRIIIGNDTGDENEDPFDAIEPLFGSRPAYPYRQDFEADEIERLTAQLEAARLAYHAAYQALVTDNPWRMAEVRARLREIGAAFGVE